MVGYLASHNGLKGLVIDFNKMIKKIDEVSDTYIIIDSNCYYDNSVDSQFAKDIVSYVIKNYRYIKRDGDFLIYYKD